MPVSIDTETGTVSGEGSRLPSLPGPLRSAVVALLVGFTSGCWVGYVLVYPVSSLPLPRYTVVGVVSLGFYVDRFARSMLDRLLVVFGASLFAYVVGFVVYAFPALVGWFEDPVVRRALYLSGLREVFLFALLAMTLLLLGTFLSYLVRNTYAEVTR